MKYGTKYCYQCKHFYLSEYDPLNISRNPTERPEGWYCDLESKMIANIRSIEKYDKELLDYIDRPLLHSTVPLPTHPLEVPEWCPL